MTSLFKNYGSFIFKNTQFLFGAQCLYQTLSSFPFFHFYASLPRTSLLQGNASTGAKWLRQLFILGVAGCTNPCS